MRIVVFCPNLVGDTVMATPTLRALRGGFPEARIVGLLKPGVAPTLAGAPWLNDVILFHPKAPERDRRMPGVIHRLRDERFDLAVLLPNSIRSALMAALGGVERRVGYARGGRGVLLTDRLLAPRDERGRFRPVPIVEYYLALARHLNCPVDSISCELFTTEADERAADEAWRRLGLEGDRPVVCLNTGGAFGPAKNWPEGHFATLARRLVDELRVKVLVVCGPAERASVRQIVAQASHPDVVSLADEAVSLGLTKASVRRSALLVTTDSGPRHFAAGFGVPVVSLFGPTHIAWTRTYHPMAVHLQQPVPCGPCQKPVCPLGHHRCMTELMPDAVFEESRRLLGLDLDRGDNRRQAA
ncbi:lipopolysaccharide heptosyltransferase II [Tautonia sociabilis]|uniref:lipopolysaccharide heptosyltransferase II n=1 Tax=Tautonia sociabilis TaxID=2080755 RepID=A0A432MHG0_9BACT|nr:lipopolysaccharide heptosyltransferase II [Tautonia sociabilis]RUL86741.1 lipopolysaccharide heptosyltransferase II [Tautonia sociabilis]